MVTHLVTMGVVDLLEPVDVKDGQGEVALVAVGCLELTLGLQLEVAQVPQPGERVGDRQALRLLVQQHVAYRHGRLRREAAQGVQVRRLEGAVEGVAPQREDAEGAATAKQRHGDLGAVGGLAGRRCRHGAGFVGDTQRPTGARDGSRAAGADRDLGRGGVEAAADLGEQCVALRGEQSEDRPVGAQRVKRRLDDDREHAVEVQAGRERVAEAIEGAAQLVPAA